MTKLNDNGCGKAWDDVCRLKTAYAAYAAAADERDIIKVIKETIKRLRK